MDDFGLEPSPELRELEQKIVQHRVIGENLEWAEEAEVDVLLRRP
jgi:hypothetical protein